MRHSETLFVALAGRRGRDSGENNQSAVHSGPGSVDGGEKPGQIGVETQVGVHSLKPRIGILAVGIRSDIIGQTDHVGGLPFSESHRRDEIGGEIGHLAVGGSRTLERAVAVDIVALEDMPERICLAVSRNIGIKLGRYRRCPFKSVETRGQRRCEVPVIDRIRHFLICRRSRPVSVDVVDPEGSASGMSCKNNRLPGVGSYRVDAVEAAFGNSQLIGESADGQSLRRKCLRGEIAECRGIVENRDSTAQLLVVDRSRRDIADACRSAADKHGRSGSGVDIGAIVDIGEDDTVVDQAVEAVGTEITAQKLEVGVTETLDGDSDDKRRLRRPFRRCLRHDGDTDERRHYHGGESPAFQLLFFERLHR